MAYLPANQLDKDEEKNQGAVNQDGGQQAPTLSAPGAMAPSNASATAKAKPTASGSFTNLNNYINANQDNDAQMGQAVRSNVDKQASTAEAAGSTFQTTAKDTTDKATVRLDDKALGDFKADTVGFTEGTRSVEGQAPVANTEIFANQINAKYQGPNAANEIQGYQPAKDAFGKVDQSVSMVRDGGIEGRSQLLKDAYGSGKKYNQGQQTLDSFILGAGKGGMDQIKGISDAYTGFGDKFGNIQSTIDGQGGLIDTARKTTDATKTAWRGEFGNQSDSTYRAIDEAAALSKSTNEGNTAAWNKLQSNLADPKKRSDTLRGMGIDEKAEAMLLKNYGTDPSTFALQAQRFASQGNATKAGDFIQEPVQQKFGALHQLLGLVDGKQDYRNDAVDFSQAGNNGAYKINENLVGTTNKFADLSSRLDAGVREALEDQARTKALMTGGGFELNPYAKYTSAGFNETQANILEKLLSGRGESLADYTTFHDAAGRGDVAKALGISPQQYANIAGLIGVDPGGFETKKSGYTIDTNALKALLKNDSKVIDDWMAQNNGSNYVPNYTGAATIALPPEEAYDSAWMQNAGQGAQAPTAAPTTPEVEQSISMEQLLASLK